MRLDRELGSCCRRPSVQARGNGESSKIWGEFVRDKKNKNHSVMHGALHLMLFVAIISPASLTCEVGVVATFYRK